MTILMDAVADYKIGLVVAFALFCSFLMGRGALQQRLSSGESVLFCTVSIGVFFLVRWPIVLFNMPLNPDEGHFIAGAMKFAFDPLPWRSVDGTSSGPLNMMVLMWPMLFGGGITFASARLTGLVLISGAWLCLHASLRSLPAPARIGGASAMMLFLIAEAAPDYNHYSSELLSIFLLCVAFLLCIRLAEQQRLPAETFVLGLALGAVPFAKLQASPIAFCLGLAAIFLTWRSAVPPKRLPPTIALFAGALTPAALVLLPVAAAGELFEFWRSYPGWALGFVANRTGRSLSMVLTADLPMPTYLGGGAVVAIVGVLVSRATLRPAVRPVLLSFLFLATALAAVRFSGAVYQHYLLLAVAPLAATSAIVWRSPTRRAQLACAACFSTLLAAIVVVSHTPLRQVYTLEKSNTAGLFAPGRLLSWLPPTQGRLLVWGYNAEYHVYSGIAPATRDTHTYNQLYDNARDQFRTRLLRDFDAAPPAVVIDAVAPGGFYGRAQRDNLFTFAELGARVAHDYKLLSAGGDQCPRLYVRKETAARLRFVPIKLITGSAARQVGADIFAPRLVDDFNIFENCLDRWLLPDGQLGHIDLTLRDRKTISAVHILNTRDARWTPLRESRSARIVLTDGTREVFTRTLDLRRYPDWTIVDVPRIPADAIRIEVTAFNGVGGGLNEVKIEAVD